MTVAEVTGELDFDPSELVPILADRFGPDHGTFRLSRIRGGQSNPSYHLDYATLRLVLRKQPNGPILRGAHAIDREYRVLDALCPTDVPVPKPVLFHGDSDALGTPFYLMERVEGRVFSDTSLASLDADRRHGVWMAAADALAAIHRQHPDAIGLGDFGKPGSYFERQIARWDRQYRSSPSSPIAEIDSIQAWLRENLPPGDGLVSLCHGDFRLGNLMFHPSEDRVVAILDWELSTLGHPLADLGFCAMPWHSAPDEYGGLLGVDLDTMRLPTEETFVARYMASAPFSGPLLPFHKAFALYRFAVIFVGIADRARSGTAAGEEAGALAPLARRFASRALEIAEGRTHRHQPSPMTRD